MPTDLNVLTPLKMSCLTSAIDVVSAYVGMNKLSLCLYHTLRHSMARMFHDVGKMLSSANMDMSALTAL